MDLNLTGAERSFYEEAHAWLSENIPQGSYAPPGDAEAVACSRAWDRRLHEAGWSVLTWPKEYGGREATIMEWLLFEDAYHKLGGPYRLSQNGISLLAPTVMEYGTEQQKKDILLPMAKGEVIWAQAWSEPQSGSDLASLTSRAEAVPGGFRLNGHKIWSSHSPSADWGFGLFRTGEPGQRHKGLTYLLFPLSSAGITVTPIRRMDGHASFGEIRFEDVFVPADQVLGAVGEGWRVAMATTGSERGFALRSPGRFVSAADRLLELVDAEFAASYPDLADRAVQCWQDAQAFRYRVLSSTARVLHGESLGVESSYDKLFWSELDTKLSGLALDILHATSTPASDQRLSRWLEAYVTALPGTIWGGTNEIQRNLLAQRAHGLPRSY
ncbi:acyl-CoA dehydrogenase family protein [Streptomyces sp. NPDC007264]|uniref:acyl-CoA dehydrogenase family protein n=1 Tax=Streptomyces sp. NPDC007264 TaxID=3364777 RepID=UPI0036DB3F8C